MYSEIPHQKLLFLSFPPDIAAMPGTTPSQIAHNLMGTSFFMLLPHPPPEPVPHIPIDTGKDALGPHTVPEEVPPPAKDRIDLPENLSK